MTTTMVRATVSKRFNIDPSHPDLKIFVKSVVDSFFESTQVEEKESKQLTKKRLITLQQYNGTTLVSIREYFTRDGRELPTSKGISLPIDQWEALKNAITAIERDIEKLEY
ncbi:ssDNA-binding transcriptional regulator domain-containing protein [Dioscorea alata]|uniref:SsDNA-binding transcriptional regulator domain-containing protein n=1 Tax=Dioscorea alata TaxID=55571 RepID=A0ACB7UQT3_DIOAL|nr:ssDNA-binding transcriptional regulator domain-containing protein [Dioscorea alata]